MASIAVQTVATEQQRVYKTFGSTISSTLGSSSSTPSSSASSTSTDLNSEIMRSFRGVIRECNKFNFKENQASLFKFFVLQHDQPVGYMLPKFLRDMDWNVPGFEINKEKQTVHLYPKTKDILDIQSACQEAFSSLCRQNIDKIDGLRKWVDICVAKGDAEHHPILGLASELAWLKVPSPLRGVFGIVTAGAHMTMYTVRYNPDGGRQLYIWVAERSQTVTYAGKLDQLVAGALGPDDDNNPLNSLKREAREEAGLNINIETFCVGGTRVPIGYVKPGPRISFYDEKNEIAGTEHGQLEPGIRYTYSLEVNSRFTPQPHEPDSIAGFHLMNVRDVKLSLKEGRWKPNCALVMLSFLGEMGEIGVDEEIRDPDALTAGLHPELPFDWV